MSLTTRKADEAGTRHSRLDNTADPIRIVSERQYAPVSMKSGRYLDRASLKWRVIGVLCMGAVFTLSLAMPQSGLGVGICGFRNALGIPCPGCGLTRSFSAISHGNPGAALQMHVLGPVIYLLFAVYAMKWLAEIALRRRLLSRIEDKLKMPVLWGLLASMLIAWIFRLVTGTTV